MLALAAERARAYPYLVPPEHTAKAREQLGYDCWLLPEQGVVLEAIRQVPGRSPDATSRPTLACPATPTTCAGWGFTDGDLATGGSDCLVDALVAWGDVAWVTQDHHDAGADHVCIQVFEAGPHGLPMRQWNELATSVL